MDWCQLQFNRLTGIIKIPLKKFEKEGFYYDEIVAVLNRINDKTEIIEIKNEWFLKKYNEFRQKHFILDHLEKTDRFTERWKKSLLDALITQSNLPVSEEDLKNYIILRIENLNELKEIKKEVDKKIKEKERITARKEGQPVELFTNEVVPDRTAEIERQMNEARKWEVERWERERLHKEQLKQDRILRTPVDKYTHALDLIIERAEFAEDGNSFSIEFYDFNFEQMIGSRMLEKFLTELQNNGCFEKYERTNYAGGTRFSFLKVNIKNLKKFKERKGKKIKREEKRKIRKITIIKMNDGKYLFAINDDYGSAKKISSYSEWWQIFIKEMVERNMRPETRTNVKEIPKDMADYFNYNVDKCPIYMGGKYDLTNIFVGKGIDTMINPDIKTEIISEKKYLIRKKKKNKK